MSEGFKYGLFVIGSPGSGKTTFCKALSYYFTTVERPHAIINLDPANDNVPDCAIDLRDLITVNDAMEQCELGPNGALTYCMEFIENNYDWLENKIQSLEGNPYMIFDLPGQVELYTNHYSLKNIIHKLLKSNNQLAAIHIVDGICLTDTTKYISTLLLCLTATTGLEMPFLNVLNKINLLADLPKLKFRLNDYLTHDGLEFILKAEEIAEQQRWETVKSHSDTNARNKFEDINKGFYLKYKGLNSKISDLLDDYSSVSLVPFDLTDAKYLAYVIGLADKATGFIYAEKYSKNEAKIEYDKIIEFMCYDAAEALQEKYLDKDNFDDQDDEKAAEHPDTT